MSQKFDFIKDKQKLELLIKANEILNIHKTQHNILVFVYTAPKVGSTSIISSLRLFGSHLFDTIHIHDEEMLNVLCRVKGITINELILFNKYLGKDVYVIDIYRSPVERKISTFFEKIGSYHFNNTDQNVNQYNVEKVIKRFNNIFSYLAQGDHFIDKYDIPLPEHFDWNKKYLLIEENNIKYIKLRLQDASIWGNILTDIFGIKICAVKDYQSTNKPIKDIFNLFKVYYKIPINYLNTIMDCKYFNYYYSPEEKEAYYKEWLSKSKEEYNGYTLEQYKVYQDITIENNHINYLQLDHYMDEGCMCKACGLKRAELASKIIRGMNTNERVFHTEAKTELIQKRVNNVNKLSRTIQNIKNTSKMVKSNNFNNNMINVVNSKKY
jgi:hypothetical protein